MKTPEKPEAVDVPPNATKMLDVLKSGLVQLRAEAARIGPVTDPATMLATNELYFKVNRGHDLAKTLLDRLTAPLKARMAKVKALIQPVARDYDDLAAQLKRSAEGYVVAQAIAERLAREKLARERAEADARQRDAERAALAAKTEEDRKAQQAKAADAFVARLDLDATAPVAPTSVETGAKTTAGTIYAASHWDFEVTNLAEVPREYLCLDVKAVRAAIDGGAREIPGLKIEESFGAKGRAATKAATR